MNPVLPFFMILTLMLILSFTLIILTTPFNDILKEVCGRIMWIASLKRIAYIALNDRDTPELNPRRSLKKRLMLDKSDIIVTVLSAICIITLGIRLGIDFQTIMIRTVYILVVWHLALVSISAVVYCAYLLFRAIWEYCVPNIPVRDSYIIIVPPFVLCFFGAFVIRELGWYSLYIFIPATIGLLLSKYLVRAFINM